MYFLRMSRLVSFVPALDTGAPGGALGFELALGNETKTEKNDNLKFLTSLLSIVSRNMYGMHLLKVLASQH